MAATTASPLRLFGGRKFTIVLLILVGAFATTASGTKVDPALMDFLKWIVGLYFAGNVSKRAVDNLMAPVASEKEQTPPA